jgi:polysaccharide export outer membrane protein
MIQSRKNVSEDQGLTRTEAVHRNIRGARAIFGVCAFLVFAALMCGGCQSPLPPLPNPPGPKTAVRLSPGDVIKASYADETIPDQTQKIRRDGKVSLPLIGEVTAAGKRVIDFQHELVRRYEGQLENNEVLVILENGMATVIIAGFANKPGAVTFDRPTTVYQAVMQAGGVSDYGSASNIHLTRIINGEQRSETVSLRPAIHGQPVRPEYVQDGDVIYIGRSLF